MNPTLTSKVADIADLCRRFGVRRLEVFGSAQRQRGRRRSTPTEATWTFLISDETPDSERRMGAFAPGGVSWRRWRSFSTGPVDVVYDRLIQNPYFRRVVDDEREVIYDCCCERQGRRRRRMTAEEKRMVKDAKWLTDIRLNAARAGSVLVGQTRDEYFGDVIRQGAMDSFLQNCGEAAWKLSKANPTLAARLPRLQRLISFRHILVHDYDTISHERVWQYLVEENLAGELHDTADALLREIDPDATAEQERTGQLIPRPRAPPAQGRPPPARGCRPPGRRRRRGCRR